METIVKLSRGQTCSINSTQMELNGKRIHYEDITNVSSAWDRGGLAYRSAGVPLYIIGKFAGKISIECKAAEYKDEILFSGLSVFGIGSRGGAEKRFRQTCVSLYQHVGPLLVNSLIEKVRAGETFKIAELGISSEGITYKKAALRKQEFLSKEQYSGIEYQRGLNANFNSMFIVRDKNGKKYKFDPSANFLLNLMLPDVLTRLYQP